MTAVEISAAGFICYLMACLALGLVGTNGLPNTFQKKFPSGGHNARSGTDLSKEWLFGELQGSPR